MAEAQRIPKFRQVDPTKEELQYSRYFHVVTPDGHQHEIEMHYLHVIPARYWRVKAGVDAYTDGEEDLGAFESWEVNDSNEVIVLVPWTQKITGDRSTPYLGGVIALFAGAGLNAEEVSGLTPQQNEGEEGVIL